MADGKRTSGGGSPTGIVCHKCGRPGHQSNACTEEVNRCFRCGKTGHEVVECQHKAEICFNCGEEGHISTQCQKMKGAQTGVKVFVLVGTQTSSGDLLIRGICLFNSFPLVTIIDTGAT